MSRTTARCFCRNLFACVVPLLVIAGTACAQDKTKTFTSEALTTSGSFTLPEFDTSLGTLQDISLTLTVNSLTTIQVFNNSGTPETFTDASLSSTDIVVVPGTVRLTSVTDVTEPAGTAQPGLNNFTGFTTSNTTSSPISSDTFSLWENQAGSVVTLKYAASTPTAGGTENDGGNLLFFGGVTDSTAEVTVEYTFIPEDDATPEPPAKDLAALAAGAMVLLLAVRHSRRTA